MSETLEQLRAMSYEEYLHSRHWRSLRARVLDRDGHACVVCDCREELQVHHRRYAERGHERLEDLATLCDECHNLYEKKISVTCEVAPDNSIEAFGGYAQIEGLLPGRPLLLVNLRLMAAVASAVPEAQFRTVFITTVAHEVCHVVEEFYDKEFDHGPIDAAIEQCQREIEGGAEPGVRAVDTIGQGKET